MKRLVVIVTVIAMMVTLCLSSFAGLDRIHVNNNVLDQSPDVKGDNPIVIEVGDRVYILGWAVKSGTNLDYVYYKLDGVAQNCDGATSYAARADLCGPLGVDAAYVQRSSVGANGAMMELLGIDDLSEGDYAIQIIAKYQDDSEEVLQSFTLRVVDEITEQAYALVGGTASAAVWLDTPNKAVAVEFTTTIPFSSVKIPNTWASRQDAGKSCEVTLSIFEFKYNAEYSIAQTPLKTTTYNTIQDGVPGCVLDFGEQLPAGTYVFKVEVGSTAATGSVYFVLDTPATTPDESYFKYFGTAKPFSLSIIGAITGEAVSAQNPADIDAPVPGATRDFSKAYGDALSYDQILVDGTEIANGNSAVIAAKKLIDGSDGSKTSVTMHGWYGNKNLEIASFGYTVDGGEPVFGDFKVATEDAVKSDSNGGPYASRFTITVDVTGLEKGKDHTIRAVAKLSDDEIVILNRVDNPGQENEKDRDIYVVYRAEKLEGFSLDALSTINTWPEAQGANFNVADTINITEGESLYALGWAYRTYTNLTKVVYRIDNQDDVDCAGSYRARTDVAGVVGVDAAWFTNSGFGLNTGLLKLAGIEDLAVGSYRLRVVAIFEDDSRLKMKDCTLVVEETPKTFVKTGAILQCDEFGYYGESGLIQAGKNDANLGQIKPIAEAGATSIKMYGWLYPEKEISDIGFSVDEGKITWGCAYYDQSIVDVFTGASLPYATLSRRYDTSKAGNFQIGEGHHTIELIVHYADDTYELLYQGDYYNDDTAWFPVKEDSTNAIGLWLNQADSYAAAIFTANGPFDIISIPAQWSSRPDGGKPATFEVALYKYVYNFEESIKLTPIASVIRTPDGDEPGGFALKGFEAEAGEYVFMVRIVELAAEAYTVLPVTGDTAVVGYELNKAANGDSFNFTIHGIAEEAFYGAIPAATEVPGGATVVDPATIETVEGAGFSISVPEAQEGEEPVQKIVVDSNTISALYNANEEASVEIKFESTAITLDKSAFGAIADSDEDLVIDVKVADATALNDAQKEVVENVALVISVDAFLGDNALHELGGNATFAVPYELPEGVDPANIKVAYVTDDGQVEELETEYVDGKIEFSVSHFSVFVVSVATPAPAATGNGSVFAAIVVVLMAGALVALIAKKRRNNI